MIKKISGKDVRNLCVELDKLDNKFPKDCQDQKKKALNMAKRFGFVVGKNGNTIEIHNHSSVFDEKSLLVNILLDEQSKIIVNSDLLWNIAEGMEIQEAGDY